MVDLGKWIEGLKKGDRLSLSKCITLLENDAQNQQEEKDQLIIELEKVARPGFRLAVTGVPGAGKSTFIDKVGMHWVSKGFKVAVLAVDPSSNISKGSILGDKTRMVELSRSENAFIRPSPTRLQLGGVASTTYETILACEAAGFERVIIETVGVGQSETLASQLSDCCLLLLVAGAGDELQGVKKGILESADIVFVNKADGPNSKIASNYASELDSISALWPERKNKEKAKVLAGSALENISLSRLYEIIDLFQNEIVINGKLSESRNEQKLLWMEARFQKSLLMEILNSPAIKIALIREKENIKNGLPASEGLRHLMETFRTSFR